MYKSTSTVYWSELLAGGGSLSFGADMFVVGFVIDLASSGPLSGSRSTVSDSALDAIYTLSNPGRDFGGEDSILPICVFS